MRRCADRIRVAIDAFLVTSTVFLPLVIGYMLPGDREDPDPDWWIESSLTRSYWFWFFLAPSPSHFHVHLASVFFFVGGSGSDPLIIAVTPFPRSP
jgi:hypothetical protein